MTAPEWKHRNAGYSCSGTSEAKPYVARCACGWRTTPRTTYERAQTALRRHLSITAGDRHIANAPTVR
jgi:hypothetical protein